MDFDESDESSSSEDKWNISDSGSDSEESKFYEGSDSDSKKFIHEGFS